jgi:Family of unknown function (DUF5675)
MTTAGQTQQAAGQSTGAAGTACTQGCPKSVKIIITVKRKYNYHDRGTPGTLEAKIEGEAVKVTGFTTEQPPGRRNLGHGMKNYPIPAGTYDANLRKNSGRNGNVASPYTHHAVELRDVPNFANIQIHTGNYPSHSEGCVILAANSNGDETISSAAGKNKELLEFIESTQEKYGPANVSIQVVVIDPPAGAQPPPLPKPKGKGKK